VRGGGAVRVTSRSGVGDVTLCRRRGSRHSLLPFNKCIN